MNLLNIIVNEKKKADGLYNLFHKTNVNIELSLIKIGMTHLLHQSVFTTAFMECSIIVLCIAI